MANPKDQIESYLSLLNSLIKRGQDLGEALANDPADESAIATTRAWHQDCGITINQLSGGSKAHWLARSFSGAFLMRSEDGQAVEGAPPTEIVKRLLSVLEQAVDSISGMNVNEVTPAASEQAPVSRRFDFVHNHELRPIVEQAYADSRRAFEEGNFDVALSTSCGILEAIVTDALKNTGLTALAIATLPAEIGDWPFETRLAVAERAGLIRGGCARLPAVARSYRHGEVGMKEMVSESDARKTGQVLHVVMRDLDPSR
jgi:hypothetical protein